MPPRCDFPMLEPDAACGREIGKPIVQPCLVPTCFTEASSAGKERHVSVACFHELFSGSTMRRPVPAYVNPPERAEA